MRIIFVNHPLGSILYIIYKEVERMIRFNIQMFADTPTTYPVHNNKFYVAVAPATEASTVIGGLETFSPQFDANLETWTPLDSEGWQKNLVTGKSFAISLSGKRVYGDAGNDYVAGTMLLMGAACKTKFKWELPNGATLAFDASISLSTPGGGDSTNVDAIEFTVTADGKPAYTAPVAG
jgi:hypothetical protein